VNRALGLLATALPVLIVLVLVVLARSRPGYFTNQQYLMGVVFLEALAVCLWFYDWLFFPLLMVSFLWAGVGLPFSDSWTTARWLVLAVGAFAGVLRSIRLSRQHYNRFHLVAFFCVASALVSAMVSALPGFSALKAFSLFLLFLYGSGGARLVLRNPDRFFRGLLLACEINVYATAVSYFVLGHEVWGNSNALGAVMGVATAPLLLWGALVAPSKNLRMRRAIACGGALYLVYFSLSRAAFLAAAVSLLLLLIGLRRQKLIIQGGIAAASVILIGAIVAPRHFEDLKTSFTEGLVYKGHQSEGILGSRRSPWQETVAIIREHPYFGSGFGASVTQQQPFGETRGFRSYADTNREHGSSYLAIMEWMGLLGILPFIALIVLLATALCRVCMWMRQRGSAAHYSVPIMLVLTAGLVHALFEDWLFAVGYYLTVLFWSFAFMLMDLTAKLPEQSVVFVQGMRFRTLPKVIAGRTGVVRPAIPATHHLGHQR
jgi:O-antigen ligase